MWKDLTLKEKAEIMKMSVANGVTDINDIQELYDDSIYAEGSHLYKNAGPLDKGKQQPKYRYGTIEQALVEGGAGGLFRVTSASRKPNEAGNAGKSSAHTYTLSDGSPAALDIVPNGIGWDEFFAVMNTPKMRASLAKHGFDILNETSKAMMAKTNATGPHLHVGRGIKGQSGTGQMFGGTSFGGGKGSYTMPQHSTAGRGNYASMMQQQAMEPITLAGSNATSPWLDYISKIGQQRPVTFNTPIGTSNSLASNNQVNIGPVDFSSIGKADELMSFIDSYTSKQALEYNLGLENNALWNSPYLLFSNHIAANGGHLFDDGSMLLKQNAINPALQYVYGENYEDVIKRRRNSRPTVVHSNYSKDERVYSTKQQADVVANTTRPTQKKTRQKQIDSPARRAEEQRKADAVYWQGIREKQGNIGPVVDGIRHPDYDPVKANQVQALREKEAKENQNAYFRRVAEHNIAEGMEAIPWPSTVAGSLFNPNTHWYDPGSFFTNLYAKDNRGFFNINQATRDFYDANPEVGSVANLIGDFVVPGAAAKSIKLAKGIKGGQIGIPIGNGAKWHLNLPINENWYYRQGRGLIDDANNSGIIRVNSEAAKPVIVTTRFGDLNLTRNFDVPFFSKGSPWFGTNNKLETIVNTGAGNYDWMPITKGGRFRRTADRTNRLVMSRVTPLVDGEANLANASDFIGFTPKRFGYISKSLNGKK